MKERDEVLKTFRTEGKRGGWRKRTEREGGRREEVESLKKGGGRMDSKTGRGWRR